VRRTRHRERGAAAVELALTIPVALMIIAGTLYLSRALHARARLVDAASFACRSESIAAATRPGGNVDSNSINTMVNGKMAGETDCIQPITVGFQVGGVAPYRHLDVTASCQLAAPLMGAFLPNFSLNTIEATASMPIDVEPQQ
jgi:Flp pilus assembly protein TadG